MTRRHDDRKKERGLTLIEVLVAFFILFVVTLAVLQLLAMAYLVNLGSMVRSELTYRAERVIETVRVERWRHNKNLGDEPCCPVTPDSSWTILATDSTCMPFWGPDGANVIEPNARYQLTYYIKDNNALTVTAKPLDTGPNRYLGPAATKVVVYVAQF